MFVVLDFGMCTTKPQRFFPSLRFAMWNRIYNLVFWALVFFFFFFCLLSLRLLRAILCKNIDFIRCWIHCFVSFSFMWDLFTAALNLLPSYRIFWEVFISFDIAVNRIECKISTRHPNQRQRTSYSFHTMCFHSFVRTLLCMYFFIMLMEYFSASHCRRWIRPWVKCEFTISTPTM